MASHGTPQASSPGATSPSHPPLTSFVFAPTRSSLARRTAVLSRDVLDRHAAGAARYRPRISVFDNELFTKGFVPLPSTTKTPEGGSSTEDAGARVASAPVPSREDGQVPTRAKRALSDSHVPPSPPSPPHGRSVPPAALPRDRESYSKLSLSELADMVVLASLTPPPNPELEVARAYPFPSHHHHRRRSNAQVSMLRSLKAAFITPCPRSTA